MHDPIFIGRKTACLRITAAAFALAVAAISPARAEPVPVDGQGWTSPAQYLATAKAADKDVPAAVATPAPAPQVAPTQSPVSTAVQSLSLPGLPRAPNLAPNSAALKVESTTKPEAAPGPDTQADADSRDTGSDAEATPPLPVRLSFLPGTTVKQKPTPAYDSAMQKARQAVEQGNVKPARQERAACAAISAYQKRQLKDLQSDQQTLQALRTAVSQLGLQKQLSFLSNPDEDARSSKPPAAN